MISKLEKPSGNSQYILEKRITVGLYRARNLDGEPVVIKTLPLDALESKKIDLVNELRFYSRLSHPNITKMLEGSSNERHPWLVLERMEDDLVGLFNRTSFSLDAKLSLLAQIAEGIRYLHSLSIIHCDIKMDNILFKRIPSSASQPDYLFKLADFGFALELPMLAEYVTFTPRGTPNYVSPEVLMEERYSFASDIYSYGVLSYAILSHSNPYNDFTPKQILAFILPSLYINLDLSKIPLNEAIDLQKKHGLSVMQWNDLLIHKLRDPIEKVQENWQALITNCWQIAPSARYTIAQVMATLDTRHAADTPPHPPELATTSQVTTVEDKPTPLGEELSPKLSASRFRFMPAPSPSAQSMMPVQHHGDQDNTFKKT